MIDLLKNAAKDDVYLAMSTELQGQPDSNPFNVHPPVVPVEINPEGGGIYDYSTNTYAFAEPVSIDVRQLIAKVFVTATVVSKYYVKKPSRSELFNNNIVDFGRERMAFDKIGLPTASPADLFYRDFEGDQLNGTLPVADYFKDVPDALKFGDMSRRPTPTPLFKEGSLQKLTDAAINAKLDGSKSFGVLSSLSDNDTYDQPTRGAPNRSIGESELRDPNRSLLDEVGDPGILLSVEKAEELGINTTAEKGEFNLDDQAPVFIKITSPGDVPMYVAHQVAEFLAYRGYENVHLKTTHSIDEVETMARIAGSEIVHPQRGDAAWKKASRSIIIDVDEKLKKDTRSVRRVYIRDRDPAWLPAIPTHKFTDMHEANPTANRYGPIEVTIHTQPGEPFFVLLGRDAQAPDLVDQWAVDRNQIEMGNPKVSQAMDIAFMMRQFKERNPDLGLSVDKYNAQQSKELFYLVPRSEKYTEQEILKMAMVVAEAAVLSEVELWISRNTCFTHIGKQDWLDQQIAQLTKLAQSVGQGLFVSKIVDGKFRDSWMPEGAAEVLGNNEQLTGLALAGMIYNDIGAHEEMEPGDEVVEVPYGFFSPEELEHGDNDE